MNVTFIELPRYFTEVFAVNSHCQFFMPTKEYSRLVRRQSVKLMRISSAIG